MTAPITTKDAAEAIGAPDAKALRVFLRSIKFEKTEGRYEFTKTQLTKLKKEYAKWVEARTAKKEEPETE